jgi:2-haloacid dehalogenase
MTLTLQRSHESLKATEQVRSVAFDAYGTLFDVFSVQARAEEMFPGFGLAIAQGWRTRQIDYTRLRSMAGRYEPFSLVIEQALKATLADLGLSASPVEIKQLVHEYQSLTPYPEAREVLETLSAMGIPKVILTNGDRDLITPLLEDSGLDELIDAVLSADQVKAFKVDPRVYQLAVDHFNEPASEIMLVSANQWDAIGARWFGFSSAWVNRNGTAPEELGVEPSYVVNDLRGVVDLVRANINPQ